MLVATFSLQILTILFALVSLLWMRKLRFIPPISSAITIYIMVQIYMDASLGRVFSNYELGYLFVYPSTFLFLYAVILHLLSIEENHEGKSMAGRNKGLVIFGIALLLVGLFASFYQVTRHIVIGNFVDGNETITPLMNVGIVLIVAGIIFLALGFLYRPRKTPVPQRQKSLICTVTEDKLGDKG
jgi:uncharacterized membrane protein YidH (DUF202 family)